MASIAVREEEEIPPWLLDPEEMRREILQRQAIGADHHDEVWDGEYVMAPLPTDEHQEVVGGLTHVFYATIGLPRLGKVRPGVDVSDRADQWEHNYRCPDVVVYLQATKAQNHNTHWVGGPDFAVEVVSRYDQSRRKFDFYAKVDTRELLIVDRFPWSLELFRLIDGVLSLVGKSTPDEPTVLASEVLPLNFRLNHGDERPTIEVSHTDGVQSWSI